jgi:hypothetical protein
VDNKVEDLNNLDTPENISILNESDFAEKQNFYNETIAGKRYTRGIST